MLANVAPGGPYAHFPVLIRAKCQYAYFIVTVTYTVYGVCHCNYVSGGETAYTITVDLRQITSQLRCNLIDVTGMIGFNIIAPAVKGLFH